MQPPKVFASYSHDSDDHKKWVRDLCTKLRENGVDVTLDQWDLGPGDDRISFMEKGVTNFDRVLVICTDDYVTKANARERGAGYEGYIITTELVQDLGTDKFIPIIRQSSNEDKTPTFLVPKVYIDFTNDAQFDGSFEQLLREIHGAPLHPKPPLGKNPFAKQFSVLETSRHHLPIIPEKIESVTHAYESAFELARADDTLGWRKLFAQTRQDISASLEEWRMELEQQSLESQEHLFEVVDKTVDIVSPLISVALAGVESGKKVFNNQQKSVLDILDVQNMKGWKLPEIPYALGYIYHSLHGGLSLNTYQLNLALDLARVKTRGIFGSEFCPMWKQHLFMGWGWSDSLNRSCTDNWKYLVEAYEEREWLSDIFENASNYRVSLTAYYMALHIHELADAIAASPQRDLGKKSSTNLNVPLDFLHEKPEVTQEATSLLRSNPALPELWTCLGVAEKEMKDSWENWIRYCKEWLRSVYSNDFVPWRQLPHEHFFDAL